MASAEAAPAARAGQPNGTTTTITTRFPDQDGSGSHDDPPSGITSPASINSPPYWKPSSLPGHQRTISDVSTDSMLPFGAITLRDNETSEHNDRNNACWAKSVEVRDHTVVNGSATNIGAFVVWIIRVETLSVCPVFPFAAIYSLVRKAWTESWIEYLEPVIGGCPADYGWSVNV